VGQAWQRPLVAASCAPACPILTTMHARFVKGGCVRAGQGRGDRPAAGALTGGPVVAIGLTVTALPLQAPPLHVIIQRGGCLRAGQGRDRGLFAGAVAVTLATAARLAAPR